MPAPSKATRVFESVVGVDTSVVVAKDNAAQAKLLGGGRMLVQHYFVECLFFHDTTAVLLVFFPVRPEYTVFPLQSTSAVYSSVVDVFSPFYPCDPPSGEPRKRLDCTFTPTWFELNS